MHANGKILGHEALLHGMDNGIFDGLGKLAQFLVAVQLGTVGEATAPSED
jgi:hypothetical protein